MQGRSRYEGGWGSQLCQVKALSLRWGMGGMPNDPVRLFLPRERQLEKSQKAVAVPDIPSSLAVRGYLLLRETSRPAHDSVASRHEAGSGTLSGSVTVTIMFGKYMLVSLPVL